MGKTKIDICNAAFVLIGETPITSLDGANTQCRVIQSLYDTTRDTLLSMHSWNFAKKTAQLSQSTQKPLMEWQYYYNLPTDMISGFDKLFSGKQGRNQRTGWDIVGEYIATDLSDVYIDYYAIVPETDMPAYFVKLLSYALAAEFALPLTDHNSTADRLKNEAYGSPSQNMRGGLFQVAMNIDRRPEAFNALGDGVNFPINGRYGDSQDRYRFR